MRVTVQPPIEQVLGLLNSCDLPVIDISPEAPPAFLGIHMHGTLIAVAGMESYPPHGLLRSLAVLPKYRRIGYARLLIKHAERLAREQGIEALYLLTGKAEPFFLKRGYVPLARVEAPPAIRATSQFSLLCPSSSPFMWKRLDRPA